MYILRLQVTYDSVRKTDLSNGNIFDNGLASHLIISLDTRCYSVLNITTW